MREDQPDCCRFTLTEYAGPGQLRWRISFLRLARQSDGWYLLEAVSQARPLLVEPRYVQVRRESGLELVIIRSGGLGRLS